MASWLFRRSNSATAPQKARTEPVDPQHTEKIHGSNASFEDVEIAELRNSGGLPSVHEDGAGNESAAQGVLEEVVQEAHQKERRLLAKLQTQEQTIRQKDQQMAVLKTEIAGLKAQVDDSDGPVSLVSFGSTHRDDSVDEHRAINTDNKQTQPDSLRPASYHSGDCDHEVAELAAATEISAKEVEIQKLKEQNAKLAETAKTDSTDSCTIETLQRELKTVKNENVTLKKQASVLKDELTVTEGEEGFDIVSKTSEVLLKKEDQIEALMDQVDEFRTGADKAEQLEEHSRVQSKHVMELKQELGATQMTYDELKDYTESMEGMVEDLESTVQSLRGSLQRANAASGATDSTYWEETIRANMAEIDNCRAKLRGSEKRERESRDEVKNLDGRIQQLHRENAALEKNLKSMAQEVKDTHEEMSEQNTVLEIARTEATIYKEDFETERKDREKAHAKIEEIREQCARDVLVLTEQNRSLILEVEKYEQGRMKEARALTRERETAQLTHELNESRKEVQAKNVQVRQYKKQVDELTFKATELERHNKDLIQEMSKVRNELVKLKRKKGDKNSPLADKLSELENLYDNSCKEIKSLREMKKRLTVEGIRLKDEKQKMQQENAALAKQKQRLEQENQQLRKASLTLKKTLHEGPPVRAKLLPGDTPEGSASPLSPALMSPAMQPKPLPHESAEQEQIRNQLKENFQVQETLKRQKFDNEITDSEVRFGRFASLPSQPVQQPLQMIQKAPASGNYSNVRAPASASSPHELPTPHSEAKPILSLGDHPQVCTPQVAGPTSQPQVQSSVEPAPLSLNQHAAEIVDAVMETQSDANQSLVYNQTIPPAINQPPPSESMAVQSTPETVPLSAEEKALPSSEQRNQPSAEASSEHGNKARDLQHGIDEDISEAAADVMESTAVRRDRQMTNVNAPYDPNLVCPMCLRKFRIGEIQKFRKHVLECQGSGSTVTEC